MQSLCNGYTIAAQSLCNRCANESQRKRFANERIPLCNHCAIVARLQCNRIATQSLWIRCANETHILHYRACNLRSHRCTIATKSWCFCIAIASFYYRCAVAAQMILKTKSPLRYCCKIVACIRNATQSPLKRITNKLQLLHKRSTSAAQSLRSCCTFVARSLRKRYAIAVQSLRNRCAIAVLWHWDRFTPASECLNCMKLKIFALRQLRCDSAAIVLRFR
jgi:hypothetical protein